MLGTYLFSGVELCSYDYYRERLRELGIDAYPDTPDTKDGHLLVKKKVAVTETYFLHVRQKTVDDTYDQNTYYIKCVVHSLIESKSKYPISRKDMLHKLLRNSGFVARSWPLENFRYQGKKVIIRPTSPDSYSGRDIFYVDSEEELRKAKAFYAKRTSQSKSGYYKVTVSEYITDPLLWKNRKMHARIFMIACTEGKPFVISRFGFIFTAAKPFTLSDFSSKEIHDTHGGSTPECLVFPEDFEHKPYLDSIYRQFDRLEKELEVVKLVPYKQAQRAYELFGLDFMFRKNGDVVLLEINTQPGLGGDYQNTPKHNAFCEKLNEWMWENTRHLFY